MYMETLMAKKSPRSQAVKCNKNAIHSRVFLASDNAAHANNSSKCYVKPNVNPVVNYSHTYEKQVIGSETYVKPILPLIFSQTYRNPADVKGDHLQFLH